MASPQNSLYVLPLKLNRAGESSRTAWVDCFAAAPDLPSATSEAVNRLNGEKYMIVDFVSVQAEQIDPKTWSRYIVSRYPTTFDKFPSESEVIRLIETGGILLGPFSSWKDEA